MNYDQHLTELIDGLKADTKLAQPYKNYLLSDAKRLQVSIRGTQTIAIQQPPPDIANQPAPMQFAGPGTAGSCICLPDMPPRKDCPVHGK